jgi:hypothetical protein
MDNVENHDEDLSATAQAAGRSSSVVAAEVALPGQTDTMEVEVEGGPMALTQIRRALGIDGDTLLFEREGDEAITQLPPGRKAVRLVAHTARLITVKVQYEHRTEEAVFPPSKTVFKVLQWAVGKKGFNLDATAAARANLILPGADAPLPKDASIGTYVEPGNSVLVVDLTLRDFTNG